MKKMWIWRGNHENSSQLSVVLLKAAENMLPGVDGSACQKQRYRAGLGTDRGDHGRCPRQAERINRGFMRTTRCHNNEFFKGQSMRKALCFHWSPTARPTSNPGCGRPPQFTFSFSAECRPAPRLRRSSTCRASRMHCVFWQFLHAKY